MDVLPLLNLQKIIQERGEFDLTTFLTEVKALERLAHSDCSKYAVGYLDALYDSDKGDLLLVMDYVDGKTLGQLSPMADQSRVCKIVRKLIDGLVCTQQEDIAHRDINPNNIMLQRNGEPIFIDYGLSCVEQCKKTKVGTAAFWAPELFVRTPEALDEWHAVDVWALGEVAHYLVTGRTSFDAADASQRLIELWMSQHQQSTHMWRSPSWLSFWTLL
jgi:serine/threonine protein kinase